MRARESPDDPPRIMGGRLNKLVALNFISVCLLSLGYRSNRVITLGVSSVFLFALELIFFLFLILFSGNRQIPGLATGAVGHSLFYSRR